MENKNSSPKKHQTNNNDYLGITNNKWTPSADIKLPNREVRSRVMAYNNNFGNNEQNTYILHSVKGYRMTSDLREIEQSISKDIGNYRHCLKRLNDRMRSLKTIRNERLDLR